MNPKTLYGLLSRGCLKCRAQMTFLVSVSVKLKYKHVPDVIKKNRKNLSLNQAKYKLYNKWKNIKHTHKNTYKKRSMHARKCTKNKIK